MPRKKINNIEELYVMSQREVADLLKISKQAMQVTEKRALKRFEVNFKALFCNKDFEFLQEKK